MYLFYRINERKFFVKELQERKFLRKFPNIGGNKYGIVFPIRHNSPFVIAIHRLCSLYISLSLSYNNRKK